MTDAVLRIKYCTTFTKVFEYFHEDILVLSLKYEGYLIKTMETII